MFAPVTTIHFKGLMVHVSRKHRFAGIFYADTGEPMGAIARQPRGHLSWETFGLRLIPVEILNTVATMV